MPDEGCFIIEDLPCFCPSSSSTSRAPSSNHSNDMFLDDSGELVTFAQLSADGWFTEDSVPLEYQALFTAAYPVDRLTRPIT